MAMKLSISTIVTGDTMKKMGKRKILFLILVLATILRLWRISDVPVSLFGDELDVGYHAYSILKTGKDYSGNPWPLHFHSLAEWRTPLYLYSAVPTVALFGISPLGVRLPAAIFGVLGIFAFYLLIKELTKNEVLALVSAAVLTFSPWHIQYSRAAFEVTQLLLFLILGLYFFFKALKIGKFLWISVYLFVLTPLIYSSAKLFVPFLLIFLLISYRKEIFKISKKYLVWAVVAGVIFGAPTAYSTFFGGGTQRFSYISVFTDPTRETEIGYARLMDAQMRKETGGGLISKVTTRLVHNKYTFWGERILKNYFEAFSTNFLFIKGDLNLRHSIENVGQLYKVEVIALLLGVISFFVLFKDRRLKRLIAFWILVGVIPSAITREGGGHATRLILILPPLVFLISYGLVEGTKLFKKKFRNVFLLGYLGLFVVGFIFYQHNYWVHNPWYSERWWHAGFEETIQTIKELENEYDKIIISNANEPPWIFFAGWYQYTPSEWHKGFPFEEKYIEGFDTMTCIDKFYFGQVGKVGIYGLPKIMDKKTLYVAVEREVGFNLIMEPERVPSGLTLIKAIPYPSGEPAFYFFEKKE
jgi:4-amino-4-deoxy-L-arabinose transferase-like glycosyltransferase